MKIKRDKINAIFNTEEGKLVDIVYTTSDEQHFFEFGKAIEHAAILENKAVITHYKDTAIREYAKSTPLQDMIVLVDYLKRVRLRRMQMPSYQDYKDACLRGDFKPVDEGAYNFSAKNIFYPQRPAGDYEDIFTYDHGIISAKLVRNYKYTRLFLYEKEDILFMTCPTNIELMEYDIYNLFKDIMEPKQVKQQEAVAV
jgi:hypothetical protein